jgi:pimeloyl-ACP methyl ester carboxylesterase
LRAYGGSIATLCLVHGSWHGPWCWERLVPHLEHFGHQTIAVNLRSDDPESTCSRYAELVARELREVAGEVVLVGHSFGGLTIPLVAELSPVSRLVYLAALIPQPGMSMSEQFETEEGILVSEGGRGLDDRGRSYWADREAAVAAMYSDCTPEDAEWAWSLLRPQSRAAQNERCTLERHPDVPTSYLVCGDDRMVSADWATRAAQARLGVEPVPVAGGHTPQISRPAELAEMIAGLS